MQVCMQARSSTMINSEGVGLAQVRSKTGLLSLSSKLSANSPASSPDGCANGWGQQECPDDDLFWTYAADFDKALIRFVPRHDCPEELELLSRSKQFDDILTLHGFTGKRVILRCCQLVDETDVIQGEANGACHGTNDGEDANSMGLKWVKTNDNKRVLHAEIVVDGAAEYGVRPLPVLLSQVTSLSHSGIYCAWVVGENAYMSMCPPRDGVWLWFPISNTELINDDFWEQLGYCRDTTPVYPPHVPASWTSLIDPTSLQQALNNFSVMETTHGAVAYDLRVLYSKVNEQASVCLRCQACPIIWSASGKVLALLGCHTDVSAENRDHLTKISFIGKISHEIRTPLNAMCGAFEVLSEHMSGGSASTQEAWAMLADATQQVRVVVDDVLDYSALSAGKMRLRKASVPLQEMLFEVVRLHSSNAAKKGVNLSLAPICNRAPQHVQVDRLRLQQVISNVISNAVKFTPEGGSVTLLVSSVANKLTSSMAYYNLDIVDTGRGIPRVYWESVFEDFNQARLGDSCVGTGLGLAICKMLVGLHGGKIFVKDSQPEKGTTFRIQLETPVDLVSLPKSTLTAKSEVDSRVIPLGTVLLVDDTKTNIIVLKALVKRIDPKAKILIAENGQTGVAMALENDVNFILMDVHMPVLDGIEATKYILASKPDMVVIGLTANTDAEVEVLCRQIGMKEVLLKPTTRPILARTLAWAMADGKE